MTAAYPLTLTFAITLAGAQVKVTDATGATVCYVKQKAFRLKEDVTVFSDEGQGEPLYHLKADRAIDIGATYSITAADGRAIGSVKQRGMQTFWSATYDVRDATGETVAVIHEENPWIKVLDGLIGMIPVAGWVAQQWIGPAYLVDGSDGVTYLRLRKLRSLIERRFELDRAIPMPPTLETVAIPAVLMVMLLERGRG